MRKADFHVHVVHAPSFLSRQGEENTDGFHPRHRRERVLVVDPLLLDEAARHQPRLVLDHRPLLVLLQLEDPF